MKLRTPVYLVFALVVCFAHAFASRNGWSLFHGLVGGFRPSDPATRHK